VETVAAERSVGSREESLVVRAANGDVAAFDALVASRIDRCYRIAWSILQNEADASDATQEAFVSAWRTLPRLRDVAAFDGWLNRIVANASYTVLRRRRRLREVQPAPIGEDPDAVVEAPPDHVTESDVIAQRDAIGRAFDRLRPKERTILVLRYVDDRSVDEIARSLGIPPGTVKSRLHGARKAFEQAMEVEA
jgi:RNA polymerase sigma-70 factor (ECF subfamily)